MRVGLIAMLRTANDGGLRGEMMLAGRSVIAWQASLMQMLGAERIICLAADLAADQLAALREAIESKGGQFHQVARFSALPAMVRADDELIVMLDGLVPDPSVVRAALGADGSSGLRAVATLPAEHPLARDFPQDFERIDAARHWGGILAMRGAGVQKLADFPEDADAISLLLRIALQSSVPGRDLAAQKPTNGSWQLAHDAEALALHERALLARATPPADWRAPGPALAAMIASRAAARGFGQAGIAAGAVAVLLMLTGIIAAAAGHPATGLGLAGLGVLAAQTAAAFKQTTTRLYGAPDQPWAVKKGMVAADCLAAVTLWFALASLGVWEPLAAMGPLVVGLMRLYSAAATRAAVPASPDRASLLLVLAFASLPGWLPELLSCLALGLVAALLLHVREE